MSDRESLFDAEMNRLIALGRIREMRPEDQILPEFRFIDLRKSIEKLEASARACRRLLEELERDLHPMPPKPF
jgi:hypothetical protein